MTRATPDATVTRLLQQAIAPEPQTISDRCADDDLLAEPAIAARCCQMMARELDGADPVRRTHAVTLIGKAIRGAPEAARALLIRARGDRDERVRANAVRWLAYAPDAAALVLDSLRADSSVVVRRVAADKLFRLRDQLPPGALETMIAGLDDPDDELRRSLARALTHVPDGLTAELAERVRLAMREPWDGGAAIATSPCGRWSAAIRQTRDRTSYRDLELTYEVAVWETATKLVEATFRFDYYQDAHTTRDDTPTAVSLTSDRRIAITLASGTFEDRF